MIRRGQIWWAELADPRGSEPGFRRPVVVVQADAFNKSCISTVLVAAITSNLQLGDAPGNFALSKRDSQLPRRPVVNVSQVLTLDRRYLVDSVGTLPDHVMEQIAAGLRTVLAL